MLELNLETEITQETIGQPTEAFSALLGIGNMEPLVRRLPDTDQVFDTNARLLACLIDNGLLLSGSMAWALQTGLSVDETIVYAGDVDYVPSADLDSNVLMQLCAIGIEDATIESIGWEDRVIMLPISIQGKSYSLRMVNWQDIALSLCNTLERRFWGMDIRSAVKALRHLRSMVYLHTFSRLSDNSKAGILFRDQVANGVRQMTARLNHETQFRGNDRIGAPELEELTIQIASDMRAKLN